MVPGTNEDFLGATEMDFLAASCSSLGRSTLMTFFGTALAAAVGIFCALSSTMGPKSAEWKTSAVLGGLATCLSSSLRGLLSMSAETCTTPEGGGRKVLPSFEKWAILSRACLPVTVLEASFSSRSSGDRFAISACLRATCFSSMVLMNGAFLLSACTPGAPLGSAAAARGLGMTVRTLRALAMAFMRISSSSPASRART